MIWEQKKLSSPRKHILNCCPVQWGRCFWRGAFGFSWVFVFELFLYSGYYSSIRCIADHDSLPFSKCPFHLIEYFFSAVCNLFSSMKCHLLIVALLSWANGIVFRKCFDTISVWSCFILAVSVCLVSCWALWAMQS